MASMRFASTAVLLVVVSAAGCLAQAGIGAPDAVPAAAPGPAAPAYSKLLEFIYDPANNLTTFAKAIKVGNVEQYLNSSRLAGTIFAPVDSAWTDAIDKLTSQLPITEEQFYSPFNSFTLGEIIKNHIVTNKIKLGPLRAADAIPTLTNLCSNAKNLGVNYTRADEKLTLRSSGNYNATLIGQGLEVGNNILYFVDQVLMPNVVTLTLEVALTGTSYFQDSCESQCRSVCEGIEDAIYAPAPLPIKAASPAATTAVSASSLP